MANRKKIFAITNGHCFYCGCKIELQNFQMDHFIPKSRGGKDKNNLVPACRDCNILKCDLSVDEFRERIQECRYNSLQGRILTQYFKIEPRPIKFYFEESNDGNLQNSVDQFLV